MKLTFYLTLVGLAVIAVIFGMFQYRMVAEANHFTPPESAVDLSFEDGQGRPGDTVGLPLVIDTIPNGLSGFDLIVTVTGPGEIVGATTPLGLKLVTLGATSTRIAAADVTHYATPGGVHVKLLTVSILLLDVGTVEVTPLVTRLTDASGDPIASVTRTAFLTATALTLPGETAPVADLDGDGLSEDLNGNGRLDFRDIVLLADHFESIQEVAPFDFDGDGVLTFDDVKAMFLLLLTL